ncbi:hypothetical protein BN946_scf184921.g8 [Trametes cinnabarina]|uniref:Adenine DNA glycosylase n=1 Tax=Pycnoporus cinnabarinus TaxID=5643 RepID=A0A060SMI7_PYCCI|nr:hypothetical protein BN946_scf184921.g8 [Trametes cinnabarina]
MSRKRKVTPSDDDSVYGDADYEQKKPRKTVKRKHLLSTTPKRNKHNKGDAFDCTEGQTEGRAAMAQTMPHAAKLHVFSSQKLPRQALLEWYDGVHAVRGMPWRKPYQHSWNAEEKAQRAYEVWVSEIMLQQTQVATVIPYYNRWMERFPTIRDLAASDIDSVNSLWKGLGYYSRAARLLSGAQKAVKEFGGRLPDNAQDMESKIPGIGRYSAGAICSIAYNQCVPVLDGNVHRLLSRLLALHAPPKAKQTLDVLWAGASAFVEDAERPGDVNQALIELGSTVCKISSSCGGYTENIRCNQGTTEATSANDHELPDIEELCTLCEPLPSGAQVTAYPMKAEKKKAREELDIVNVIEWHEQNSGQRWFLLVRRPEGGLLAGLHEFPTAANVPVTPSTSSHIEIAHSLLSALLVSPPPAQLSSAGKSDDQTARRSAPQRNTGLHDSLRVTKIVPAGEVLHIFSHIRKTYRVQWIVLEGGSGDEPPALVQQPDLTAFGAAMPKTSKGKLSAKKRAKASNDAHGTPSAQATQWVRMEDVAGTNIGTGVMKIWRQVHALWGGHTYADRPDEE